MEQTALRPKPMPGQEPDTDPDTGPAARPGRTPRRPHAARRRGRRLTTLLFGLFVGTVLVLSGVGLGTVGATVIGMSKLADLKRDAEAVGAPARSPAPTASGTSPAPAVSPRSVAAPARATLGLEVVDAEKSGALVVGVHLPGPGHTAGLVQGDVLLTFDDRRVDSATDLVHAVDTARPGQEALVTVRHPSGGYQQLTVRLGVVV
ncbi:MAG: PDZ domain-containing protein [Streptomyces sp.]|nr:PDZ domain-containing protein [Streptomyces sp.]